MEIKEFIYSYSSNEELIQKISEVYVLESRNSIDMLADFIRYKDPCLYGKHETPKLATIALINKGEDGINKLISLIAEIDNYTYQKSILSCLWFASKNLLGHFIAFHSLKIKEPIKANLSEETVVLVKNAFYEIVIDNELMSVFLDNTPSMYSDYLFSKGIKINVIEDVMSEILELTLKINRKLISKFSELIERKFKEEEYQIFLRDNPVFIDATSLRVFDKHKLGDDLITDFVVETLKNDYYVVEIEKPHDKVFNKNKDFSNNFTHAFGQVLQFIDWIESNIAYAQKKLPGIMSPKGILIIGRSKYMSDEELGKLKRFNRNSKDIIVLTYDDILTKANNLYDNLRLNRISIDSIT